VTPPEIPTTLKLGKVLPLTLELFSAPKISLDSSKGRLIKANFGIWDSEVVYFTYKWFRNKSPVDDGSRGEWFMEWEGDLSYSVNPADAGQSISLSVTGYRPGYGGVTMVSNSVPIKKLIIDNSPCGQGISKTLNAPLDSSAMKPSISGSGKPGQTLKGKTGKWAKGTKVCVFWIVGNKTTPKLKSSTYKIQKSDVRKEVKFVEVGTKDKISKVRISKATKVS
jgi:hypothetical protein